MDVPEEDSGLKDNGGTRSGTDRRHFAIIGYTPERRHQQDRRSGIDRRNGQRNRGERAIERRDAFKTPYKDKS
jgi:hypothetical protein